MPKVGSIVYEPAQVDLPVKFTARTGKFSCSYASQFFEATEFEALKQEVLAAVKTDYALTWIPIIELSVPEARYKTAQVYVHRQRKYVAYHEKLGWRKCHWEADADKRLHVSEKAEWFTGPELTLPAQRRNYEQTLISYLPYSDEAWQQLEEIDSYLQIAAKEMQKGMITLEGIAATLVICRRLFDHYATEIKHERQEAASNDEE